MAESAFTGIGKVKRVQRRDGALEFACENGNVCVWTGTVLPMPEAVQHTGQMTSEILLMVYPGQKTSGTLYEDDGASFGYERGKYSLTQFTWADGKLRVHKKKTGYKSAAKRYRVLVAGRE